MSFWSKLGKGLAIGVPALFTAGASIPAVGAALGMGAAGSAAAAGGSGMLGNLMKGAKAASGILGPVATGLTAGAQKGRESENNAAQEAALFKLKEQQQNEQALENRAQLDLQRKKAAQDSQTRAYDLARKSALAKNMKDVTVSGVPSDVPVIHFSGGMRPSAYGKEGMDAATLMNQLAMKSLMDGESFDALPQIERTSAPNYKGPSTFENIMGGVATGANAYNSYRDQQDQKGFQQKILDAIQQLSGPQAPMAKGALLSKFGTPKTTAGVQPFWKPPTAQFPLNDPYADQSNR